MLHRCLQQVHDMIHCVHAYGGRGRDYGLHAGDGVLRGLQPSILSRQVQELVYRL